MLSFDFQYLDLMPLCLDDKKGSLMIYSHALSNSDVINKVLLLSLIWTLATVNRCYGELSLHGFSCYILSVAVYLFVELVLDMG